MKKLMLLAVVAALAIPAMALGGQIADGKYTGTIKSVDPSINGKAATAEVKNQGDKTLITVTYEGGKELWTLDSKSLMQQEFDNTGKVTNQYGATFVNGQYAVNCKDKAKNECDAGIDSRNAWKIDSTANGFNYYVYGVGKDKKADAAAKPTQRHEFAFKLANPTAAAATTPAAKTTTPAATTTAPAAQPAKK